VWAPHALVLHSFGGKFLGDAIDLIFLNTDYVSLLFELRGVNVSQPCDERAVEYKKRFGFARKLEVAEGRRIFVVQSEAKKFFVIAAKMWVLVRAHNPSLSLRPLLGDDLVAREAFINQHVKEWFTMSAV
jgi:hypothetical protein